MLQKVANGSTNLQETFINTQVYLSLERANHTEKSNLDVMDVKSDSKDTLMSMLQNLHQQFVSRQGRQYLVEGMLNFMNFDIRVWGLPFHQQFKEFIQTMACREEKWRFWIQYVFVDAMAYVSLFFAIRSGDWHLRVSSVKSKSACSLAAFDHPPTKK